MRPDCLDEFRAADNEAGLWPAEQLVPAEGHDVTAGCDRLLNGGLVGQATRPQVHQTSAAEIEHDRKTTTPSQVDEVGQGCLGNEAADREVAVVDFQ